MILDALLPYFRKLNESSFSGRGMEWYLVPGHYWLELRIHQRRNQVPRDTDGYNFTTNIETAENRGTELGHRGKGRREELKTEEPIQKSKDISKEGRLSEFLQNNSDDEE